MSKMQELVTNTKSFMEAYERYIAIYNQRKKYDKEAELLMILYSESKKKDEVYMMDLVKIIGLTPGAISQTTSRAENKGFVKREMSTRDRRAHVITLTEKGLNFCEGFNQHVDGLASKINEVLKNVSSEEINNYLKIQSQLTEVLESYTASKSKK